MFLYSVAIRLYIFMVYLASPFNRKAKKLMDGRKDFFKLHPPDAHNKYIWFHCASLGEFEQARPLIEKIKKEQPDKKILLSFFSSSGYEVRKNYEWADEVIYLPFDSASNAKKFFSSFHISVAVFVKYDVWPFYLRELLQRGIPTFLTSATFRKGQFYFKWYGKFIGDMLRKIKLIFVQDEDSLQLAKQHQFTNVIRSGDVRVDRVVQIKSANESLPEIERFAGEPGCFIFGSVYPSEIPIIEYVAIHSDRKIVIAPHQVNAENVHFFKQHFKDSVLLSNFSQYNNQQLLIIDNVGLLNKIYKYGTGVYMGGGFGKGIHNILEPAVWGNPVYIGPRFHKFPEAHSMMLSKMVWSHKNPIELAKIMCSNKKDFKRERFEEVSQQWFKIHSGATSLIYRKLIPFI